MITILTNVVVQDVATEAQKVNFGSDYTTVRQNYLVMMEKGWQASYVKICFNVVFFFVTGGNGSLSIICWQILEKKLNYAIWRKF